MLVSLLIALLMRVWHSRKAHLQILRFRIPVGLATIGVFAQHYLDQGITLAQLASWSQCGEFWTPGEGIASCTELFSGSGRLLPQTLALTTLVCMEMFKALAAVSVDTSIFRVGPQDNKWLILGVSAPFLLHLFVLYSSKFGLAGLGESFGMVRVCCSACVIATTHNRALPHPFALALLGTTESR